MKLSRWFRPAHIPSLLVMGILFYLSSQPSSGLPPLPSPRDKIVHAIAYMGLGWTFCLWIKEKRWLTRPFRHAFLVLLACAIFGVSDEIHQSFVPGRSVSAFDLMADMTGALMSVLTYRLFKIYRIVDPIRFMWNPLAMRDSDPGK